MTWAVLRLRGKGGEPGPVARTVGFPPTALAFKKEQEDV